MKPHEGGVQSLVPKGKGYAAAKDLPDMIGYLSEADKNMMIPRYDPDEPMKYLGILPTMRLSWGWAVDAAMEMADRAALCIRSGSKRQSISHRLMSTVAEPVALYKLMVASIGEQDVQTVQSKCYMACKAALGLARSTSNDVASAVVSLDWLNPHCTNQMAMVIKMLLSNRNQTKGMLASSLRMHQLCVGWFCGVGIRRAGVSRQRLGWYYAETAASVDGAAWVSAEGRWCFASREGGGPAVDCSG